jgi:hypothetical protein
LTSILRNAKSRYYSELLESSKNNVKNMWKILNKLIAKNKSKDKYPNEFKTDDDIIKGDKNISEAFNDYFVNIGPNLASKIARCDNQFTDYMGERCQTSMFLNPVTEAEILTIVKATKNKFSPDCNDITMDLVKKSNTSYSISSDPYI